MRMLPTAPLNCRPIGTLIVSKGVAWWAVALNSVPSAKVRLLAVLARKEPPMFSDALEPKIIPLGLSKNRLAVPLAWIVPSILEVDEPVTRLMMF